MQSQWTAYVRIVASSNVGQVVANTNRSLSSVQGAAGAASSRVAQLAAQARRLEAVGRVATYTMAALGVASTGALLAGVKGAADLQTAMVGIQNATGATATQLEMLRQKAFDVSAATAQSVVDSANVMKVMATSGINNPNRLLAIAKPAALFADVQFLSRGVPFEEGAKQAIQIAHLFQAYDPAKVMPIFDQLTKLSQMMPDNLNRYVTQAGYYMPLFRRLGVDDEQSLVLGAFMDRMGLGRGKGGTGLQNFLMQQIQPLQLTSHMQKGRRDALQDLGLLNPDGTAKYYNNGHFDVIGSLERIDEMVRLRTSGLTGHARDAMSLRMVAEIQKALGVQGGRIGFLGTPEAVGQLHQMLEDLKRTPGLYEQQARYMNTLSGQFQLFKTNFQSLLTEIMWPWLDRLRDTFSWLATKTHDLQRFLHQHPAAEKAAGVALGGVSVAGLGATGLVAASLLRIPVGGAFRVIGGALSLLGRSTALVAPSLTRIVGGFRDIGAAIGLLGERGGLKLVAATMARFGVDAVPFVGQLLLIGQAVQAFLTHADQINTFAANVQAWWDLKGWPAVRQAVGSFFARLTDAMKNGFVALLNAVLPILLALESGNLLGAMGQLKKLLDTINANADKTRRHNDQVYQKKYQDAVGRITGQQTRDYNKAHPENRGRSKASVIGMVTGGAPAVVNFHYHAPAGEDDVTHRRRAARQSRAVAAKVASVVASAARTMGVGSTIDADIASPFEFSGAVPA